MAPVVALTDKFDEEQVGALLAALPAGSEVISLPDGDDPATANAIINWRNDVDDELLAQAPQVELIVKMDSGR